MKSEIVLTLEEYKKVEENEKKIGKLQEIISTLTEGKTVTFVEGRGPFGFYQRTIIYNPEDWIKELAINKALVKTIKKVVYCSPFEVRRIETIRGLIEKAEAKI